MIVHDVTQGSPEWLALRLGIPTASEFDRILTPKTRKLAAGADTYRAELVTEWLLGYPIDNGSSGYMERGTMLEAEARAWYEFNRDVTVQQVGFLTRDDGQVGGSPDGLVGEDGIIEIKCPSAVNHVRHLLGDDIGYVGQCQGLLYLTGRKWVDRLSYNPALPPVVQRVERDSEYINALDFALLMFLEALAQDKEKLAEHRRVAGPAFLNVP